MRTKRGGSTCRRKRRRNSSAARSTRAADAEPKPIPGIGPAHKIVKLHTGFKFTEGPAAAPGHPPAQGLGPDGTNQNALLAKLGSGLGTGSACRGSAVNNLGGKNFRGTAS